jgi:hypothetical protein
MKAWRSVCGPTRLVMPARRPGDPWGEGHRGDLAALAQHGQGAVAALFAERFDVDTERHTRRPFNASSETSAWSRADDSPALTRIAPSSLRPKCATCEA